MMKCEKRIGLGVRVFNDVDSNSIYEMCCFQFYVINNSHCHTSWHIHKNQIWYKNHTTLCQSDLPMQSIIGFVK